MEFTINRDILLKSLSHAHGIIEKKTTYYTRYSTKNELGQRQPPYLQPTTAVHQRNPYNINIKHHQHNQWFLL